LLNRIGFLQIGRQRFERRSGRGRRHPWFKATHDPQLRSFAIVNRRLVLGFKIVCDLIVNTDRQPNFRRQNLHRADESLRRDSNDRERAAIDKYL